MAEGSEKSTGDEIEMGIVCGTPPNIVGTGHLL